MKRLNGSSMFMVSIFFFLGVCVFGAFNFLNGLNKHSILVQQGNVPKRHILNDHMYLQSKRGLIISLTCFFSGLCFTIMILLPSEEKASLKRIVTPKPTKPTEMESSISAPVKPIEVDQKPEPLPTKDKEETPVASIDAIQPIETIITDTEAIDEITEGEDDVVYGTGKITDAAIMHFVHRFPDSALKFLYRKNLDGKALSTTDEDIYEQWEIRGLTRGKVKSYILTLMEWKEFPKRPLYEIWKLMRDHIFENVEI